MTKSDSQKLSYEIYSHLHMVGKSSINDIANLIYNRNGSQFNLTFKEFRKIIESKLWYAYYQRRLFKEKKDFYSNSREIAFSIRWNPQTRDYLAKSFNIIK